MDALGKIKTILMTAIIVFLLPACGNAVRENRSDVSGVYGDTVAGLEGQKYYAVVETNAKNPVLLVTDSCYEDEKGTQVSIDAEVYYETGGGVKNIGRVSSLGTAYPIAYDKTGIYAGGGHGMQRYEIDEAGELTLAEGAYVTYDESGNAFFAIEEAGNIESASEEEYQKIWDKYESAEVVNFTSCAK
ncbi:MAG: hypothetical protein K2K54_10805 [Lachnospiraceae bacterium]|nr:hypothetical protein [Lachnospiraceae bacterium]